LTPKEVSFFGCTTDFVAQVIEDVEIGDRCGELRPEFNLVITNSLNGYGHLLQQTLKLLHLRELLINVFGLVLFGLYVVLKDVLVSEDCELLLYGRFLFGCHV
jgi:hypothetical protein